MQIKKLLICLLGTFIIGGYPILFVKTDTKILITPSFQPPDFLFPIVWSILFILMGISCYLIYKQCHKIDKLYITQLVVNSLWTIIFFGLKLRLLAFIWILLLVTLVILLILRFYEINKTAGLLLIPYLLWISFAAVLNYSLYLLNR